MYIILLHRNTCILIYVYITIDHEFNYRIVEIFMSKQLIKYTFFNYPRSNLPFDSDENFRSI